MTSDHRMKSLNKRLQNQGIRIRKTRGKQRKNDPAAALYATLMPYAICTERPSRGFPLWVEHSIHPTLEAVESQLRILGLDVDSRS